MSEKKALYHKYRPHKLEDLIGQDHVKTTISNAVKNGRLKHAYLFCGIRGTGKCVVPDTLIYTDYGIKEIGDLAKKDIKSTKEGTVEPLHESVLGIDNKINNSEYFYYGGKKKTLKIKTKHGYSLECTKNHPILVFDKDLNFKFKKSKDIEVGDYLPISCNGFDFEGSLCLKKIKEETIKQIKKEKNDNKRKTNLKTTKLPNVFNGDLSYLMGIILGDGCLTNKNYISISCAEEKIEKNIFNIIEKNFNITPSKVKDKRRKKLYSINLSSRCIRVFFEKIGLSYNCSGNKIIPKSIYNTNPFIISNFISGLLDSDGWKGKTSIGITLSSEKIINDLQSILATVFGIYSYKSLKLNKKYNKYYYKLTISGKDNLINYFNKIGTKFPEKFKSIINYTKSKTIGNTNTHIVPFLKEKIEEFKEKINLQKNGFITDDCGKKIKIKSKFFSSIHDRKNISYKKAIYLKNSLNFSKELLSLIDKCIESNYFYSPVESIENGESFVCDLNIPKTSSFVSNSIISHNTTLARIMSLIFNCENAPSVDYDINDGICKAIINGNCPDVIELDAASNSSIDEVRNLRNLARSNPVMANKKVFIIDEVHCLKRDAASALLKILEEPPKNTIFILCTTDPQRMLKTILSRCQRFDLRRVPSKDLAVYLRDICKKEGVKKIEEEALSIIARAGMGSVRDSISLLDSVISSSEDEVTVKITEETISYTSMSFFYTLFDYILNKKKMETIIHLKKAMSIGKDPQEIFNGFLEYIHSTMLSKTLGTDSFLYVEKSIKEDWRKQRDSVDISDFLIVFNVLEQFMLDIHYKPRVDLTLDACIIQLLEIFQKK